MYGKKNKDYVDEYTTTHSRFFFLCIKPKAKNYIKYLNSNEISVHPLSILEWTKMTKKVFNLHQKHHDNGQYITLGLHVTRKMF